MRCPAATSLWDHGGAPHPAMPAREALQLFKSAASSWNACNAPRLGASLAYYALLSLAPLLILLVALCALLFNQTTVETDLLADVRDVAGYAEAQTLKSFFDNAQRPSTGIPATSIALITLLFGASGVFVELRDSMNIIWDAPKSRSSSAFRQFLAQRLISFAMVLALGTLVLASLVLSAGATMVERFFTRPLPLHLTVLGGVANDAVSLVALVILFALLFKFVPAVRVRWNDVIAGAILTAVLFEIGKALLALYIGTAGVGSAYGAAGSLVALVVWVYYSAQILFFGAAFTRAYAGRSRSSELQ
jgi:membrane protein